jgi:hypothetical protein
LSSHEVGVIEATVGNFLEELGYALSSAGEARKAGLRENSMRAFYSCLLNAKLWLKSRTPAGRLANLEALELSDCLEPAETE